MAEEFKDIQEFIAAKLKAAGMLPPEKEEKKSDK